MSEGHELQPVKKHQATLVEVDDEEFQLYVPGQGSIGQILINQDVIARIAGMAVEDIEGVTLGSRFSITDIFPGKEAVKGITVEQNDEGRYRVVCEVKIAYRTPIQETANRLQRHVKDTVERMTGLPIQSVDIKIVDIFVEKGEDDAEED